MKSSLIEIFLCFCLDDDLGPGDDEIEIDLTAFGTLKESKIFFSKLTNWEYQMQYSYDTFKFHLLKWRWRHVKFQNSPLYSMLPW